MLQRFLKIKPMIKFVFGPAFVFYILFTTFQNCSPTAFNSSGNGRTPTAASAFTGSINKFPGVNPEDHREILIYRSYNGSDYLFSDNPVEGPKAGYFPQEARFEILSVNAPGTIPLFKCLTNSKKNKIHFLTTDANCEGQTLIGTLGYIASSGDSNLVALSRYANLSNNAHVYLVPGDNFDLNNWKFEGIQGYVFPTNIPAVTMTPDDGRKYFGFYAGAMDGVGNQNYIPELAKNSNLIFIKSANFEEKLIECERLNLKAIVTFDWIFLDTNYSLKSDYAESFTTQIEPILRRHLNTIAGFYGLDEPYMNGRIKGLSDAEVYNAQETMGRFLKSKFPNIPIGVIFEVNDVINRKPLFPSFDWFGFDCYSKKNKCKGESVDSLYSILEGTINGLTASDGKKRYLISVPQAGHPNSESNQKGEESIQAQVPTYRSIFRNKPNVKVVMPFLWQSFNDGTSNWTGAREMPNIVNLYNDFYQEVMSSFPNTPPNNVVKCAAGSAPIKSSPDSTGKTNTCNFTWSEGDPGQTITATSTNGGSGSLSCGANGAWSYSYVCPAPGNPVVCAGGSQSIPSLASSDGKTNICTFTWEQGTAGQKIQSTGTNGGTGSLTCGETGVWSYGYNCPTPDNKVTCSGGSNEIASSTVKGKTCLFSWPLTPVSSTTIKVTGTNGGTSSGICTSTGEWKNVVQTCP